MPSNRLARLAVPIVVWTAARLYGRQAWIPPSALLGQVVRQQLLPLAAGMALVTLAPRLSQRVQRLLNLAGNLLLVAGFAVVLVALGPALALASPWVPVAAALLAVASMAVVRLLLQVDDLTEHTLAICNANRHVGLALLIGGQYLHAERTVPAVASYALLAPLLMSLYARRLKAATTAGTA